MKIAVVALAIATLAIIVLIDVYRRIHNLDLWIDRTRDEVHKLRHKVEESKEAPTAEVESKPQEFPPSPEKQPLPKKRFVWTDGQMNQLRALVNIGKTDEQIATIMKLPIRAVTNKRYNMGLKSNGRGSRPCAKNWTDAERKLLGELFTSGFTVDQMAAYLNRTEDAVRCRLSIEGLKLSERKK